jgi:chromosome segregation ATPase
MRRAADVRSIDAVRNFRADLAEYQGELRQAVELLTVEIARGVGWFDEQMSYWPAETRRASDRLAEARAALSRCLLTKGKERESACDDERQAVARAKARLSYAEQQIRVTKLWVARVRHEIDEFRNRVARLVALTDGDLPRALASLDAVSQTLDTYVGQTAPMRKTNESTAHSDGSKLVSDDR